MIPFMSYSIVYGLLLIAYKELINIVVLYIKAIVKLARPWKVWQLFFQTHTGILRKWKFVHTWWS